MIKRGLAYLTACIVMLGSGSVALAAETVFSGAPSVMQILGTIQASAAVSPQPNDKILIFAKKTGVLEGQGVVIEDGVSYMVALSKADTFKGTVLVMQFQQADGGAIYQLDGDNTSFPFTGSFPLPTTLTINPTIGTLITAGTSTGGSNGGGSSGGSSSGGGLTGGSSTGGSSTGGSSTGGSSTGGGSTGGSSTGSTFDANGDGQSNQQDIDQIKQALSQGKNDPKADINGDGIVNTRDIIDAIKAFRALSKKND